MAKAKKEKQPEKMEERLFKSADKLRKNIDASQYKHIVLGLVFLKYIGDSFDELHTKLANGKGEYEGADPEDKNEYLAEAVFFVPEKARWQYLVDNATSTDIGKMVDNAMELIEKDNPTLKGILPKVYAKENLDKASLGGLINLVGNIALGDEKSKSKDVLGKVYEYFLGQFALAEGKNGGQFYTPACIVQLLVEMLEPYEGRVLDPCCGSGGMFVQSEKFIENHSHISRDGKHDILNPKDAISIFGQESNQTTWGLCKMNLALRGIDSTNVFWNNEGSFLNDAHKDKKVDFVIANPPFNDSDWSGEKLTNDGRWQYGVPSPRNANYAWIQHFLYHLNQKGKAGFVLAKGSLSSKQNNEGEIRKNLIENHLVDCIVNLPAKLFLNTQIPACLWFLSNAKANGNEGRKNEILFIDARNIGTAISRRNIELTETDIEKIASAYHNWKKDNEYEDEAGFCKSASIEEVAKLDYVLTPGRYVGLPLEDDDFDFEERVTTLTKELSSQMEENKKFDDEIKKQLAKIGVTI